MHHTTYTYKLKYEKLPNLNSYDFVFEVAWPTWPIQPSRAQQNYYSMKFIDLSLNVGV
jgi:hypothetical protein